MPFLPPYAAALMWAHLGQQPFRVLLSIAGVSLGVLASVAIGAANVEVLRSFEQAVATVAGSATLEIVGHSLGVDETVITPVRRVPGVVAAFPVIEETAVVIGGSRRGESIPVYGLDLLAEVGNRGFQVHETDRDDAMREVLASDAIYVGEALAANLGLAVGQSFDAKAGGRIARLRIAGILRGRSGRDALWERAAVMDVAAAQVVFSSFGKLQRIDLVTEEGRSPDEIAKAVKRVVPPHLVVQRPAQRSRQVENMVRSFQLNLTVLSWVGLLVGTFLIYNTTAFAVAQRRREIGIYRALGMTKGRVAGLFLLEGAALGLAGGVLGGIAGLWLSQKLVVLVGRTIADLYVPVSPAGIGLSVDGRTAIALMQGVLFGSLVSMVGALAPSIEAGRTVTVRALAPGDYEQTQELRRRWFLWISFTLLALAGLCSLMGPVGGLPLFGYFATLCLLASLACLSPVCIQALGIRRRRGPSLGLGGSLRRIAADHAARHPGRNAVTVSALMVGLAIMIGVVVMVRSFRETVESWVNETVMADLIVAPPTWLQGKQIGRAGRALPGSMENILSAVEGVAAVDTYRDIQVEAQGQSVALVSRDLRLHAERSRYLFTQGDSTTILNRAAETGGILVSEVLASRLGLMAGGSVSIMTPQGAKQVHVEGVFYDYSTDGGKMVMEREFYRREWQDDQVTVFAVYLAPGADDEQVRARMVRALAEGDERTIPPIVIRNRELREEIMDIFDRTFVLTYVLEIIAVMVAVLGIVNTLVMAVLERRRELATLKAIGASDNQLERLVLWEALYLGLIGAALGVMGGLAMAWLLITVINKQSFGWTIRMTLPVGLLAQAVVLSVSAALIAGYFPARWAARQPVVEGLREE